MKEQEIQEIETVTTTTLLVEVDALRLDGWRLVQILALNNEAGYELNYSFGGGYAMRTLRLSLEAKEPVPSITAFFRAAYLYENEIRDLYGIRIERIDPYWEGRVYDFEKNRPFGRMSIPAISVERPGTDWTVFTDIGTAAATAAAATAADRSGSGNPNHGSAGSTP